MKTVPLGDVPLDKFFSEYWQKKPLLVRNALPDIKPPIAADELAGLACEEAVESRLVIQDAESDRWDLTHGPFTDETFRALPDKYWTLLVQAVDHWVPEAAEFLTPFHFIPSWRIDDLMISYSVDGGGVGPHYDNYDVFLVQACGRRQWEVGGTFDSNSPRRSDTPVMILSDWKPEQRWILEPGDLLYVPPRVGHSGIAVGDDCMTCSVGFRAPSHSEILRGFADYIGDTLNDEVRYEDSDLVALKNPGSLTPESLGKVHHIVKQYLEDKDLLAEWFGRFITAPKYPEEASEPEAYRLDDLRAHIANGGMLKRNEGTRMVFQERDRVRWLFVDGRRYECPADQKALVQALCTDLTINPGQYQQTEEHLQLLLDLLNRGSLYFPAE
ncbi:MAG: cupin [Nitrospirales bacterium]|nr:MAG: cupin [Nitrospirales bacterium]